ncbi:MAG TPA: hypothetical protein PKK94_04390 [Leptospiraceae bacterium]|nr:hypothetical protein [Leptospiraceae bacterium]
MQEALAGKDFKEIIEMKEDALKFKEKIEKGMINRLEKKQELSPRSSQRRKYELERWVTSERKKNEK